ncbi:low molecular weight protein-tyrosine-phosphatase [Smaragdicoccus niigatensis]|uniref:low molecular weight protein-tyrosine-phosphatase n=1 Tax=Smaragdicoccus niigatensis TaxID=359359 RepID=UPI000AB1D106|nr:low molecular weight protein-tyrosine-phosphatase [Smaragdicoccus niigatensis]
MTAGGPLVTVCFVCTGNICRSPMAEKIFAAHLVREGLDAAVQVTSAGTGSWHVGDEADPRTIRELREHGYPTAHIAAQFGREHSRSDLVISLDAGHDRALARLGIPANRRRLLRSFDPAADGTDVADPYYGGRSGFIECREQIEAAVPGMLEWVRNRLAADDD